jgi:hypothetical protein
MYRFYWRILVGNYFLFSYSIPTVFPVHNFCAFGNQKSDFQNRKKKNRKVDLQKKSFTGKDLFFFYFVGGTFSDTELHNFCVLD